VRTPRSKSETQGTLRKVGQGLYRYSTSGVYFAHVRIRGKLFRESLQTTDSETAKRKLSDFRRKKLKVDPKLGKMTLADLLTRYFETLGHLSKSSLKSKNGIIAHLRDEWPKGSDQPIVAIKPGDCETWISRQARRLGHSQYNAYVTLLRDVLLFAVRNDVIADNPAEHLKYLKREKPIRLTPTWNEFQGIVADIRAQPFNADAKDSADFVEFMGLAGLGQAEIAALTLPDIDFKREQMTTFRHKTRTGFIVPIYPQLRPLLERIAAEARREGRERVFAIKDAKKAISGACRRLGLPNYSARSFRRMFITRAIELGVDVKVIAEWQGHKDGGKLILDTYSHVNRVHSRRMAQLMTDAQPENVISIGKSGAA
jgi:integrase